MMSSGAILGANEHIASMESCPSCNAEMPAGARYCPACGVTVPEPQQTSLAGSSLLTESGAAGVGSSSAAIDHGQFVPGTIVDERYRIVGRLGRGGMGEVYRADDLKLGQSVALKFLPARLAKNQNRLDRFLNEVRLARQVSHANVCRVFDIAESDGRQYITMEYVDGEDLASLIRRIGALPRDKGVEIALQLCAGLSAAHERGILHRDLKPANVMLDGRGHVRITDFGLASLEENAVGAEVRAGTPAYMAPEQLLGKEVTAQSDIFALGLLLYEAFTGRKAFEAATIDELRRAHAERSPIDPTTFIEGFDPAVARVLMRCLERDPRDRPASGRAVAAALPGGDPLAAAIAAGETPSPELVAASAHSEGMPPSVCLASLIVILAAIFSFPWLNDQIRLFASTPLEKNPAVLIDRAREVLRRYVSTERGAYSAFGFTVNQEWLERIEDSDRTSFRWSQLSAAIPAAMEFWYRESPDPLIATGEGPVRDFDPPLDAPGMSLVRLAPNGRLLELLVIPPTREFRSDTQPADWWASLREEAGPLIEARPADSPAWVPPVYCDQRVSFRGRFPNSPATAARIEIGALNGRPVYFRFAPEWSGAPPAEASSNDALFALAVALKPLVLLACAIGAVVLARRNLHLGRGDRRGAVRISGFVGLCLMGGWLLVANHTFDVNAELPVLVEAAGRAVLIAGICWVLYIALEPQLRRIWPDMLIAWSRLLRGRFRDPLVGRDILIGGLFGIVTIALVAVRQFGPGWFGGAPPRPLEISLTTMLGLKWELAELLRIATTALFQPLYMLVLLLLLLVAFRRRWLALLVFYFCVTAIAALFTLRIGERAYGDLGYFGVLVAVLLFVLIRFGLLALILALFYQLVLNSYPITANWGAWYADGSTFALSVLAALTLFGFFTALARRPLFGRMAQVSATVDARSGYGG